MLPSELFQSISAQDFFLASLFIARVTLLALIFSVLWAAETMLGAVQGIYCHSQAQCLNYRFLEVQHHFRFPRVLFLLKTRQLNLFTMSRKWILFPTFAAQLSVVGYLHSGWISQKCHPQAFSSQLCTSFPGHAQSTSQTEGCFLMSESSVSGILKEKRKMEGRGGKKGTNF